MPPEMGLMNAIGVHIHHHLDVTAHLVRHSSCFPSISLRLIWANEIKGFHHALVSNVVSLPRRCVWRPSRYGHQCGSHRLSTARSCWCQWRRVGERQHFDGRGAFRLPAHRFCLRVGSRIGRSTHHGDKRERVAHRDIGVPSVRQPHCVVSLDSKRCARSCCRKHSLSCVARDQHVVGPYGAIGYRHGGEFRYVVLGATRNLETTATHCVGCYSRWSHFCHCHCATSSVELRPRRWKRHCSMRGAWSGVVGTSSRRWRIALFVYVFIGITHATRWHLFRSGLHCVEPVVDLELGNWKPAAQRSYLVTHHRTRKRSTGFTAINERYCFVLSSTN